MRPVRGGKRGGEVVVEHRTASITHSIIILSENPFMPNFMGMGRGRKMKGKGRGGEMKQFEGKYLSL